MDVDPAKLRIEIYPAAVLKQRADEIDLTPAVARVAERMIELMHSADGIGLAAPQVGLPWRLFVAHIPGQGPPGDPPADTERPEVYINPVIEQRDGHTELAPEGCLSIPGVTGDVIRPPTVTMSWTDPGGHRHTGSATGLLARCWQHELDHLDGVLILDRMTEASRLKARPTIRALERQAKR